METTTAFDLNQAIQRWRDHLGQAPALRGENLAELESHLRDSVADLEARGLSSEEAFIVASRRIGTVASLETEFGKVNQGAVWVDRLLWMLIGVQLWQLVFSPVGMISNGIVSLGLIGGDFNFSAHGMTIPAVMFALVRLLAFAGSLALCWWLVVRRGQGFVSRIQRFLNAWPKLTLLCCVLCLISWAVSALGGVSWAVTAKFASPQTIGEILTCQTYANAFGWFVQTGVFILLTLLLARKRLQLSRTR